jgi:hypothetical protein
MDRLQNARHLIPHHHPALYRPHGSDVPLWERAWDGGSGLPFGGGGNNTGQAEGDGEGDNCNMDEDEDSDEDDM